MILIIVGLMLFLYPLLGYRKKRRLETNIAEYFYVGIGKSPIWVVDGDKLPWFLRIIPLPWPFVQIYPLLRWWEFVEGKEKKDLKIINRLTKKEEPKYKQIVEFGESENGFMGLREEHVPSIKKYEPVSYEIPVLTKDKFAAVMIVSYIFEVLEPMKVIRIPGFKMLGQQETENKLRPWATDRTIDELQKVDINSVTAIIVPDPDPKKPGMDLEKYLDEVHFKPIGFEIFKKGLRLILSGETKKYFTEVNKGRVIEQKGLNAEKELETRKKELAVELQDANQRATIIKNTITEIGNGLKDTIDNVYNGKANVAGKRPYVLVEVQHEADETGEKLIESLMGTLPKIIETTSAQKYKKEEVEDEK